MGDVLEETKEWVDKVLKVTLTDGRVYVGKFVCIDWMGNFVLNSSSLVTKLSDDGLTILETDNASEQICITLKHATNIQVASS